MKKKEETKETTLTVPIQRLPPVAKTLEGLRDALFDELNLLRQGKTTTSKSRAVAILSKRILEAAMVELVADGDTRALRTVKRLRDGNGI